MGQEIVVMFLFLSRLIVIVSTSGESTSDESNLDFNMDDLLIPTNSNSSIQYLLYTPNNTIGACYIEPIPSIFDGCPFNSTQETKFLIHGYLTKLKPGNMFEKIKDTLLKYDKYNVIIVNWTKYNQQDYAQDMAHAYLVGVNVAAMINFITLYTKASASSIHIIGHSLGGHLSGVAGKRIANLGRITGMDPAGPGYTIANTFNRLTSKDAQLVDVIHTSDSDTGYGLGMYYPMGRINFYPNGGRSQPMCAIGKTFYDSDGGLNKIQTPADQADCFHNSAIQYFNNSIFNCNYLSTQCSDYISYKRRLCQPSTHVTDAMGFHCITVTGIQDQSMFFLDTSGNAPFC